MCFYNSPVAVAGESFWVRSVSEMPEMKNERADRIGANSQPHKSYFWETFRCRSFGRTPACLCGTMLHGESSLYRSATDSLTVTVFLIGCRVEGFSVFHLQQMIDRWNISPYLCQKWKKLRRKQLLRSSVKLWTDWCDLLSYSGVYDFDFEDIKSSLLDLRILTLMTSDYKFLSLRAFIYWCVRQLTHKESFCLSTFTFRHIFFCCCWLICRLLVWLIAWFIKCQKTTVHIILSKTQRCLV